MEIADFPNCTACFFKHTGVSQQQDLRWADKEKHNEVLTFPWSPWSFPLIINIKNKFKSWLPILDLRENFHCGGTIASLSLCCRFLMAQPRAVATAVPRLAQLLLPGVWVSVSISRHRTSPSAWQVLFCLAFNSLIPPPLPDQWQHSNFTEDIRSTSKTTIKLLSALIDILALTNPSLCSITQFKRLASPTVKSSPCF